MSNDRQPLRILPRHVGDALVLEAQGHVDLSTRLKLSTALNDAVTTCDGAVVLDLCEVNFIDSTGIGVLLNALRRLTRQGRLFAVVCPPSPVRRVFEVTGLDGTFALYDEIEPALESAVLQARPGEE
jgi:anti-sigma B factor antagonist